MSHTIRNVVMLSATALALIAAPVLTNQTALSDLQAIAKDKGNGGGDGSNGNGGGGGSNGSGGGGGSNGSGGGGGSENGNGGGKGGNSGGSTGESRKSEGKGKKVAATEELATTKAAKATKTKNLNAQLAGLNSLKRNVNGLMNSSGPRMEQIRSYIEASAALEAATAELGNAEILLGQQQAAFETYLDSYVAGGLAVEFDAPVYDDPSLETLNQRLGELDAALVVDPMDQAATAERTALLAALEVINTSPEAVAVSAQQGVVDGLVEEVAGLEALTTEEVLQAALLAAANKNRVAEAGGASYLTPEIMAWATARIEALTDQYQAQQ